MQLKKISLLLASFALILLSIAAAPVLQTTNFTNLGLGTGSALDTWLTFDGNAQDFYVALDDSADDLLIGLGSTVGTTPIISMDENLATSLAGDATVAGVINYADTDSVLTGAQTITPTYTYLQVSPTAALTLTLSTGGAEDGDLLVIHNLVTTNTNIVDTGATAGGGALDLGQDDTAGFIFGDGVWVEIFSPDNS